MTIQGSAPSYAPISPIETTPGEFAEHAGYAIGIAYHLGDFEPEPADGWLVPGPGATWVLHGVAEFPAEAVPEPTGSVLAFLALVALSFSRRRRVPR